MNMKVLGLINLLLLVGCVSNTQLNSLENSAGGASAANPQDAKQPVLSATTTSMKRLSRYGALLSVAYRSLADRTQTTRDATTVALIGYAADAANDALRGASAANLGERAIVGTAFSETTAYLNPASATGGLLLATKRSLCLSNVSATAAEQGQTSSQVKAIVIEGYSQTQLDVRNSLRGVAPDYSALATKFADAVQTKEEGLRGLNTRQRSRQPIDVKAAVASCLLTGEN